MSRTIGFVLLLSAVIGCGAQPPAVNSNTTATEPGYTEYPLLISYPDAIGFHDRVASQPAPETELADLAFTETDGQTVVLRELLRDRNLVVVVTRGYNGSICPYCSTQVSRLIANYAEIQALWADVAVIYPLAAAGDVSRRADFLQRVNELNAAPAEQAPPFPVLLDVGLKAVDLLGIRKDLSKPATYILDRSGAVKFAYVGNSLADRPSVKAILEQLRMLQSASAAELKSVPGPVSAPASAAGRS